MKRFINKNEIRFFNYLLLNASFNDYVGLLDGKSAVALYCYSTDPEKKDEWKNSVAFSFLEEILSQINLSTPLTFGGGIAGAGILLEHLTQEYNLEENTHELLEESEPYLLSAVYGARLQNSSIANGVSGLGLYFMHRFRSKIPAQPFQQLRFKEAAIACVDQIAKQWQEHKISRQDLTIFHGISGICLFLNWINKLGWHEPFSKKLLKEIMSDIIITLNTTIFSWQKTEAYFCLLHCELLKNDAAFKEEIIKSFKKYLEKIAKQLESIDFYSASFIALWLELIAKEHNVGKAKILSCNIKKRGSQILKKNALCNLFIYNPEKKCVPIGLLDGVCSTALPLLSLETKEYRWLSIFGINISTQISHSVHGEHLINAL
ncbi:lanthionine synthetase LanC family protein [Pedobacter sp. Hv1]|uniref:lanthionine synthetase LanC family protein n=1 Tax=Pedobacter sp. Hv1 TaxID=1740090 RepID=UPI0006D8D71B|nr:lanthionine synthetase LanC family protein [Pedobacter sp. Hv1]KQB99422.1 hypothetical protein AQF98_17790 [Pedobacter sp. Hv1]